MFYLDIKKVFFSLNTTKAGLTQEEALLRQKEHGLNKLDEPKKKPFILKFLERFHDFLIIVLLFAAALSVAIAIIERSTAELFDAALIMLVVLINAIIGLTQEARADKAMENLKKMTSPYAKVIRDGKTIKITTEELVLGDIVLLEAGDIVPADLRLFEVASLKIEESALTGESVPSQKEDIVIEDKTTALGNQFNMAFMGTVITYGRGRGVVVATGMNTQIGKIANLLATTEREKTPLTKRIDKTAKTISLIVLMISIFVFLTGLVRGDDIVHSFMLAVAIAVCAIPEGLPAALTVTLSFGVQEMSRQKAIIRKLPAVETLGSTQVICSDKTGTLTLNKMVVQQVFVPGIKNYIPELEKSKALPEQELEKLQKYKAFEELLYCMTLCNDSQTKYQNEVLTTIGDPTETALVHYGYERGYSKEKFEGAYPRVDELPFDSNRKLMTTIHEKDGQLIAYTKGALDNLLLKCTHILKAGKVQPITKTDINNILAVNTLYAKHALRMLGFAYQPIENNYSKAALEQQMIFVGLVGMMDPPREEVFEAIKTCKRAGILPIMITGDHKDTAFAIAKQLGIATLPTQVITGAELDAISDKDLVREVNKFKVYARVNPEHKVRIVMAFKAQNKIVAMTGDGVNDAPSLKAADIGIGMGISGTDVTKGVAGMILTDDNFATIVGAVKEGRKVYSNILKILQFLLTTSIAEVILMVTIIALMGRPFFTPVLILWINFVSDTLPALALGTERAEPDIMLQKPTRDQGNILASKMGFNIFYMSTIQAIIIFALYFISLDVWGLPTTTAITMCFASLVVMELFHSYNLRSETQSLFKLGVFSNKYINYAFIISFFITALVVSVPIAPIHAAMGIVPISFNQWLIATGFAFLIVPIVEFVKIFERNYFKKRQ